MFDNLVFQSVPGRSQRDQIRLLALSTCGFCRRGQEFLESHGLAYEFIHLDTLEPEVKAQVKQQFKENYGESLSYPALVVNDKDHTIGYVKRRWEELLGIPHEDEVSHAEVD